MQKLYRIALPVLALWLVGWTFVAWAAIQDDALIHLRYADNLYLHHFVTYDGVHQDYGASSLLYITLLAILRGFTGSANLPHAVSTVVHLLLFGLLAFAFARRLPAPARAARLAALSLLVLLVMPSAMRWLDDGMETGLVVGFVSTLAFLVHAQSHRATTTRAQYVSLAVLALFAVLLRTELLLLFAVCFLILVVSRGWLLERAQPAAPRRSFSLGRLFAAAPGSSHLLVGATVAVGIIVATMHVLLPDTAVAKSHGISHWMDPFQQTEITLGGALSFGVGMLVFWLLTLSLVVLRARRLTLPTLLANIFFPTVLMLSSLRGQEIQGVRYFAWTFFFSTVWNILELSYTEAAAPAERISLIPLFGFLALLLVALPFEVMTMHRVLRARSATIRGFEAQHLEVLSERRGIAFDIGYIGYFSRANICDLAGLVNGRAAAKLTKPQRFVACAASDPDFVFLTAGQLNELARLKDLKSWTGCGQYDLVNVHSQDRHYLVVRPSLAEEVCRATGNAAVPFRSIAPELDGGS